MLVDRLSQRVALEPSLDKSSAMELAHMLHKAWITMGFGLPAEIVSDRDPRFRSDRLPPSGGWSDGTGQPCSRRLPPRLSLSQPSVFSPTCPPTGRPNVDAADHAELVLDGIQQAREGLLVTQERQSASVNKSRRDVTFQIGDRVLLSAAHVRTVLPATATAKLTSCTML